MSPHADPVDLVAAFPAAGSGGTTLEQVEKLAARRGLVYLALANPDSVDAVESGRWRAATVERLRQATADHPVGRVLLFGHCMGGLSAVRIADGLAAALGLPVRVLAVNTPCPDQAGRIPTMTDLSDAEIGTLLAHDGFPQDLLDDEDMLAEIADGLRDEARVADRLAEQVAAGDAVATLHLLSMRGDAFIPPERCVDWWRRVDGDFQVIVTDGGHGIDETSVGLLERVVTGALTDQVERV
ncbi:MULTISPECIES: thioesterase II family protein [Micromonospora]|uniref:Alpha/beta hydrolase family protein n=1 Tax=Micromonospora yangpuensis TaxID=683228 RepID=A0A1C6UPU6_9ACTN|nr:alpha/beta fold hydrolase [Micromonospora yangpuensis]GGM08116.1 hypothetical protein GCM10012279_27780 [Micromonospora yangpuensis]SCL56044.1 Alpha/beta hydrolase family protein [Micromonospora yangpuensis]